MGLRINDPSRGTATTPASDDYLLMDGTTNGTRNILTSKFPLDTTVVHKTGTETISGAKTFSSNITNNANEYITNTTYLNQNGIILKNGIPFIHDFSYGNNGTITPYGENTFVGINSGNFAIGSTATIQTGGSYNSGFGYRTLLNLTSAAGNTAIGHTSCQLLTTGSNNTFIGQGAGYNLTSGAGNIGVGVGAGRFITDGTTANQTSSYSTYLGFNTKPSANGNTNEIIIGYNTTGAGSNTVTVGNINITKTILRGVAVQGTYTIAPTGVEGGIYYNSTDKHFYGYNGVAWKQLDN